MRCVGFTNEYNNSYFNKVNLNIVGKDKQIWQPCSWNIQLINVKNTNNILVLVSINFYISGPTFLSCSMHRGTMTSPIFLYLNSFSLINIVSILTVTTLLNSSCKHLQFCHQISWEFLGYFIFSYCGICIFCHFEGPNFCWPFFTAIAVQFLSVHLTLSTCGHGCIITPFICLFITWWQ